MKKILDIDETTSSGMVVVRSQVFIVCDIHTGGTWTMQIQTPGKTWLDTDVTFDSTAILETSLYYNAYIRFTGGNVGAQIWASGLL